MAISYSFEFHLATKMSSFCGFDSDLLQRGQAVMQMWLTNAALELRGDLSGYPRTIQGFPNHMGQLGAKR